MLRHGEQKSDVVGENEEGARLRRTHVWLPGAREGMTISPEYYQAVQYVGAADHKMKQTEGDAGHGGRRFCLWRPFTIGLGILLFATQVLVVLNLRTYYLNQQSSERAPKNEVKKPAAAAHLKHAPRMDKTRFEIEVVKPHKTMRAKFSNHPDMVINKLFKILDKEKNKTQDRENVASML